MWEQLEEMGCHLAQGYLLSRPLPPAELEEWMSAARFGQRARRGGDGTFLVAVP
jgi:sensor c-di-GMP phosphodiesterase-like protein